MINQELTPEQQYEHKYRAYQQAESKRLNTLAALAYAKKYTVRTGNLKPPRLNADGSEMTGEEGQEEKTPDEEVDPTENVDRKYSCLMVTVDETALTADIHALHSFFDVEDIIELELRPHVTIKYGLHTSNFADVVPYLTGVESINLHIGDLSLFTSDTQDVLKFTISSDDLVNLRSNIDRLPNTDNYPTYNPHLTVAYLKPGTGHKYLGYDSMSKGMVLQARSILFTTPERNNNEITLNAFCPTGDGGGVDPSCSPKGSKISNSLVDEIFTSVTGYHDDMKLDIPVKTGIKAAPKCANGQGDCTNQAFLEYQRSGAEVWVGEVVLPENIKTSKDDLRHNLEKYGDGQPGPVHSVPHAWNVVNGKIIDHALGSKRAADHIYFGKRIEKEVLDKLKHGDDLASLEHPIKPDWSVYDRVYIPQPTGNAFCATGEGGGVDPSCGSKLPNLKSAYKEKWDDGTEIEFLESPFSLIKGKVENPTGTQVKQAKEKTVNLLDLQGTQKVITDVGLAKPADNSYGLPLVVKSNGIRYIQDGHHRLTQELLKGNKSARVRYIDLDEKAITNAFCPTGEGGGVDPSCSPGATGAGKRYPSGTFDSSMKPTDTNEIENSHDKYLSTLKQKEVDVVTAYVIETGNDINNDLRKGKEHKDVPTLDKVIGGAPKTPKEFVTMRGMPDSTPYKDYRAGDTITEKAYTSTSLHYDVIDSEFGKMKSTTPNADGVFDMPAMLYIKVPKGSSGLMIGGDAETTGVDIKEYLLPRNSEFKVLSTKVKSGARHIQLEYLGPKKQPTVNAFCATGAGGGIDPSCSPKKQYITKVKVPKLKLPTKPDFISSQKGNVKENKKAVNELTKLAKAGNVSAVASHPATPSPKVVKYKADLLKALDTYHKGIGTAGLKLAGVKPKAATPASKAQKPDTGKTVSQKQAQTGQTTTDAAKEVIGGLGLTPKQVKDALTTDASPASSSKAQHRVDIVSAILSSGTAVKNAAVQLIHKQDKAAIQERVKAISSGEVSRAAKEYADTPLFDLNILSAIKVHDYALGGQAVCYMADRRVEMGTSSVTGDFRHELGHAIRASWGGSSYGNKTALTKVVSDGYDDAMARVKKDPPPGGLKLTHDEYETKYGVVGRRSLDNWEEHAAEQYRRYHKAIYQDKYEGGNGVHVLQYRNRHPNWSTLWDAHYTAALIGQEL